MPPSLYGVLETLDWAEHHLGLVEQSIGGFFGSDPYPIMTERDPENGVCHARLVYPKKLPVRDLSLMIGNCMHNMRPALDYIAWELAGGNIADLETMFPIFDISAEFKRRGMKSITRLSTDARTVIERLEPYNTQYGVHQLALPPINKIDATDKHKLLTVTIAIAEQVICNHGVPRHVRSGKHITGLQTFPGARLIHNAMIATFTTYPPIQEMEVDFKFTPQVEFGEIQGFPKHSFVIPNLTIMLDSVAVAIKRLRRFFESSTEKG